MRRCEGGEGGARVSFYRLERGSNRRSHEYERRQHSRETDKTDESLTIDYGNGSIDEGGDGGT